MDSPFFQIADIFKVILLLFRICENIYAAEKGLPLINGNLMYDQLGLNGDTDFSRGNHLSAAGVEKLMVWLDDYLRENADLPDHRGDERFKRWENNCRDLRNGLGLEDRETEDEL